MLLRQQPVQLELNTTQHLTSTRNLARRFDNLTNFTPQLPHCGEQDLS
jgi:hypothetical protein